MTCYEVEFDGRHYSNHITAARADEDYLYVEVISRPDGPGEVEAATFRRSICPRTAGARWHRVAGGVAEVAHMDPRIEELFESAATRARPPRCECFGCLKDRPRRRTVPSEPGDQYVLEVP